MLCFYACFPANIFEAMVFMKPLSALAASSSTSCVLMSAVTKLLVSRFVVFV